jgi:hydroxypyruvate reductase
MDARRRILLSMLAAALAEVEGRAAVRRILRARGARGPHAVIAIGKAALAMLQGAQDVLAASITRALVVTKRAGSPTDDDAAERAGGRSTEVLYAGHPVPDARSIEAGHRLLAWIAGLRAGERVLLLISGGASSLVELPRAGVTLAAIQSLNERALRDGLDIESLNAQRAQLSHIKAGGLTHALAGHSGLALFISDVPGDDPAVIGSGLAGPAACDADLDADLIERVVIANVEQALRAAAAHASALGLEVEIAERRFAGDALEVAAASVRRLREGRANAYVAGGESVVQLPSEPGRGGRNQHLALGAARVMRGDAQLVVLAVGSDGNDGPTEDAGAMVDGGTWARVEMAGYDPARALVAADAGSALEAAGDLIHTGPTGTNVGDFILGLRLSETRAAELLAAHGEPSIPML